ncbi:ankyrin-2 isoform X6 [Daphnia magna]|uniref:ankyrin-2 isoform X6 n=1 Tax=Daphnia magna TaxID=35525 RepID=UPI001E1BC9FC|nr:ankyrin-2 isoform X6 [Daphnia magna]
MGRSSAKAAPENTRSDAKAGFLRSARDGHLDKVLEHLKNNTDINTSNANGLNALHLASKEGHVDVVTELLKRGAAVDSATKKGNTALHIASLAGQEEVVKILVLQGASVNVQSQNGFTPLYMAAQENHDGVVRFLLANGANQSLATEDGFTPLAVALQQGHDKVVSVLLENDTRGKVRLPALHIAAKKDDCKAAALLLQSDHNPDVTSKSGFTPLHIAAHYGNENIASLLVQKGADVNFLAKHHITPLHVAAKWGKANMAALLLDRHAQLEAKTRDGLTPLHCAARSGHESVVDLLLERGAPISSKTKNGLAPLHMAAQGDHVDAGRILLHHKAPVDEVTVDYLTALHVAAHCGHVRVAKLLLDRKADPNSRALNGFTPLHIACKKNRIKVIELLLKHGASIEATTESGLTPLHVASFMGCMNIVIYLLQHGANANAPTMRGEAPLHLAARANQTDIVRILLRNNAQVDARAREQQTPLHIASRLGNVDIVMLLLQHNADLDAVTKDMYTPLHIAAKEGQDEVAAVLLEHGANNTAATKRGFTPLHLAAKYGNIKVARLLIQKDAPVDAQGKNGVTPLHVASHYDHQSVALLLLDKGASPHAAAKNGYTPLHIAAKKNQMDIATTLLEYGAQTNAESKAGFTPLHLSAQEGHTDMSTLLIEHQADPNYEAKNGLTPMHLCAQEDRVNVAAILVKSNAQINAQTKSGYTPLHVACHFGQMNMVRFLLGHQSQIDAATNQGYTAMHQAAQQGHPMIVNLLLESGATPNAVTSQGQTALSIAQKLGYITVIETLKVVTETTITTTTTTIIEEKYRVQAPETMQETFMSDSEDEGGEDGVLGDHSYRYLTVDEMKSLGDDSMPMDGMGDDRRNSGVEETILAAKEGYAQFSGNYAPDNVDLARQPVSIGHPSVLDDSLWSLASKGTGMWRSRFLVSFMVDARGGAMRGCRHSGVRVIIPPRKAACPMRITCRYLKKDKLVHPPPLMEGEALASRILELGPSAAKFLGPVIIEVPHFAALRGKEREIIVLRSDNGETWREHTLEATEEAVQEVLNESFDGEDMGQLEDMNTHRITRILTTDFPQYFAIVSRVRQEVHAIGPDGGMVSSSVVPQVQAVFPPGALTKKIKVGLQAQPIQPELVVKLLGNRVAVSPIVTVEPRRRKFHRPITLTIPVPQAAARGMINQYSGDTPTLRLLCSITGNAADVSTGGTSRAQWEDVTGSTPLTFVNDCVSFTTTVSARFWLMDCRNVAEAAKMATDLYREAINVPFMAKFVVFAKRHEPQEARLRVFCMTDDKEEKTLEQQEHFVEVAKSRDVEVLETKSQYLEFAGNLVPITKSGEQLALTFRAFRENRLPFTVRVKDNHADPVGRIAFMREARAGRGEPPQTPICNLNIVLPSTVTPETARSEPDLLALQKKYGFLHDVGLVYTTNRPEAIHKADLRLSDICNLLGRDWIPLAQCLEIPDSDLNLIDNEYPDNTTQQAMVMLKLWMAQSQNKVTGNALEKALRKIGRDDIVNRCIYNVELVTDDLEKAVAKTQLDQSGFDNLRDELGADSTRNTLQRDTSLDVSFDEQDLMKDSESVDEIPEKREEEEELNLQEVSEVFSQEIKTAIPQKQVYDDAEPPSQRIIIHEEKGICDSREAEKDIEIPQPVQDLESGNLQQDAEDSWGTRQSTMEERVIDRYVIDTHPKPVFDPPEEDIPVEQLPTNEEEEEEEEEEEIVEEPMVVATTAPAPRQRERVDDEPESLYSPSWNASKHPVSCKQSMPIEAIAVQQGRPYEQEEDDEQEVERPAVIATSALAPAPAPVPRHSYQRTEDEPEVLISSSWDAANEPTSCDDEVLEKEFAAALHGGDIDDSNTFSPELLSRSLQQQTTEHDAKVRMSTSKTPPSSPLEAVEAFTESQMHTSHPEAVPAQVALAQSETIRSEDLDTTAASHVDVQEEHWTEDVEANEPAAVSGQQSSTGPFSRIFQSGSSSSSTPVPSPPPPPLIRRVPSPPSASSISPSSSPSQSPQVPERRNRKSRRFLAPHQRPANPALDCEDQVQTDVTDDVGDLSESELFDHAQPKLEEHERTTETEELLERHSANSETSDVAETIYGSPEAVRYFQKVAIPPSGTESTVIHVDDLSARSKLVVRPLSLPDTYVDRHGSPGTKHRRTDFVVALTPQSKPEIQRQSAPLSEVHFQIESTPVPEGEPQSDVELGGQCDSSIPVSEAQLHFEPSSIAQSGAKLEERKSDGVAQQEQVLESDTEAEDSSRDLEQELLSEANLVIEQVMKLAIEQVTGRAESEPRPASALPQVDVEKAVDSAEIEPVAESRLAKMGEPQSDMKSTTVGQLLCEEAAPQLLETDSVGLAFECEFTSGSESDIASEAAESGEGKVAAAEKSCDPVSPTKPESEPESLEMANSVPVLEVATKSDVQPVLKGATDLIEAEAEALLQLNSESDSASEAGPFFIPQSKSMLESVPVQGDHSVRILDIDRQSDLEQPAVETITKLEISSADVLDKSSLSKPEAVPEGVSLPQSGTESDVGLVLHTSAVRDGEAAVRVVECVRKPEVESLLEAESVLETEPVVHAESEESSQSVSTASDQGVADDDMDELYTEEEDFENKSHAARVASVLNDQHRPRPDESPLDERAERMAEAILASAMFETVFLQPENRSQTTTPVPAHGLPAIDLPFIGSSFCRIQFPCTDARLTSAGNTAASTSQSLVTNHPLPETESPEIPIDTTNTVPSSRIPVLSKRQNLSRSVSEQPHSSGSRMPVAAPRVSRMIPGYFTSADHTSSADANAGCSAESLPSSIQENVESYSVRKQFWEEVASGTSSTSSTSSTRTRQTKSERSSLIVTDESFGPIGQRETKSERSSAVLSEQDIYEVGRYTVTKVSTSETVIDTTHESTGATGQEIIEELQLAPPPVDQSSSKVEEIETVRTQETTVTRLSGKLDNPIVLEETVTGSSHRERIGREEYIYSSGDESVSLRAEDVESHSDVVLPGGRQVVTEEFAKSSKTVFKDGQPVFVEEFQYDQRQQPADSPPLESAPTASGFEDSTTADLTTGDWTTADSVEVNVDSQEQEVPDISIVHQESFGGGLTSSGESQEEGEAVAGMAFINTAFIGVDHIDMKDQEPANIARAVSPFEVPRGEAYVIGTYGPDFDQPAARDENEPDEESPLPSPQSRLTFELPQEAIVAEERDECAVSSQPRSRTTSLDSQDLETYGSEGEEADDDEQDPSQAREKIFSQGLSFQEERDRELTPEEALQLAENLIEEIKAEAPRRAEMMSSTTPDDELKEIDEGAADVAQEVAQTLTFQEETEAKISEYIRQVDVHEEVAVSDGQNTTEETINWSLTEIHESSTHSEHVDIQGLDRTVLPELDIVEPQGAHEQEATSPEQVCSPERETTSTTSSGSKIDSSATFSENKTVSYEETSTTWTKKEEETTYFSAAETGAQRPSRPTSSDVEALISTGATTACSSEYETAFSSSSRSVNSSDFHSAVSSVSSRESMKSLDSTTGLASETSETLLASALEQDTTDRDLTPTDVSLDLNQMDVQFKMASDLPAAPVQREEQEEVATRAESPFEMISPVDEGMVELEDDDDDDPAEELIPPVMKRSQEMTFHPEPKPLRETGLSPPTTPTPSEESPSLKSSLEAEKLLFDYVMSTNDEAAYLSTSTLSDGTTSTVIEAGGKTVKQDTYDQLSDEPEADQDCQEDEANATVTALDAATITSRSGSLASSTDVEGIISRQVTISSAIVIDESTQSINTQITTRRVVVQGESEELILPASMVPDITVQHASPVIDRRFSYPENVAGADLSELAKQVIEEVPSEEELEERDEGLGAETAEPAHQEQSEQLYQSEEVEQVEEIEEGEQELAEEPEEIEADYPEMDVGELISPPALVARRIDPPNMAGYNYEMSFERAQDEREDAVEVEDVIEDLEKQKRWMEMQFEEAEDAAQGIFQPIASRVQPLADIEECKEDEESLNGSDRLVGRLKESLSSTPEFDVLSGRRYFTRSGDVDDLSVDSLQDFERLELELHAEKLRRQSNGSGSQESLNGRRIGSRSSGGDNVSVNSLTEFERLERDMAEAAKLEERARQQEAALLSEIEEGHESQTSESESCETLSGQREGDDTEEDDDDDYEQRMFEIDEIIRQAQTNIEQFETELTTEVKQTIRSSRMESTGSFNETTHSSVVDMKTESVDSVDSIEPDFLAGGSTSQRTAAIYRSCIRTEIKYSSDDIQQADSLTGGPDSLDVFGPSSVDSLDSNARSRTGHESDSLQAMVGAESSSDSSSSRDDLPRDTTLQRPTGIFRPTTCSSDSLEQTQSSSRATGGFDSDSIMSGSMTSSMGSAVAVTVHPTEAPMSPSGAPVHTERTETSCTVEMSPEIRKVTFHGPDVEEQMKDFVSQFAPGEDIREVEVTDPVTGNIFVTRVTQRRAFVDAQDLPTDEDDLPSRQAVEEYIRTRGPQLEDVDSFEVDDGSGNIQRVIRKRVVVDSTATAIPTTHSCASPSLSLNPPTAFQSSPATEPTESTPLPEMTSSGAARNDGIQPRLPSAPRDSISIDDDDDDEEAMEVDSHEHDWRIAEFAPNTTLGRQQATVFQLITAEADDQAAASAACQQYDPTCSAISESEPSLPSQPDWSDSAQDGM